jgi:hypothetical protein
MRILNFSEIQTVAGASVSLAIQGKAVNFTLTGPSDAILVQFGSNHCGVPEVVLVGNGSYEWTDYRDLLAKYFYGPQTDPRQTSSSMTDGVAQFMIIRK